MGLFDKIFGKKGQGPERQELIKEKNELDAGTIDYESIPVVLDRLWHVRSTSEVRSLVNKMPSETLDQLVDAIDLTDIPLNPFCINEWEFGGIDDRIRVVLGLTISLLEAGKDSQFEALLKKIDAKLSKKVQIGASEEMPSYESKDIWRIGEALANDIDHLAKELLKKGGRNQIFAAHMLDAVLLDNPERIESRFWRAAAWNNAYLNIKDDTTKKSALASIDDFLKVAENNTDYLQKVESLRKIRKELYE